MKAALIALALAGCIDEGPVRDGDPHGVFEFREVRRWTLDRKTIAMDSDRAGGAWVIFEGTKTLVHLGRHAETLAEISIAHADGGQPDTAFAGIAGLAFGGDVVWVSYDGNDNMLRAFDAVTGEQQKSFATETGIADIDVLGDELRYSVRWDTIAGLDEARGGERWRMAYDGACCGIQRGIASLDDDLVWVSTIENRVFLIDRKIGVIGSGLHRIHDGSFFDIVRSRHLGWDGEYLMIQQEDRIHWLEPLF